MSVSDLKLDKARHIKYWTRCLKTVLPRPYQSMDSSRMTLAFFILSSLDLLGAGTDTFSPEGRTNIKDWVSKMQHPDGGFCGSPNHRFPDAAYEDVGYGRQVMDPANLPATFFGLLNLSFVGGLELVKREKCLKWLRKLQRPDGSFGEMVAQDGTIKGGSDMRYCQVAGAIRWMLRGNEVADGETGDINLDALVNHIRAGQTYDGGIGESSRHEAHAGYTYCAVAALKLINRLDPSTKNQNVTVGLTDNDSAVRWLISRQTDYTPEVEESHSGNASPDTMARGENHTEPEPVVEGQFVGFNGRCNKRADTCYAFWVGGALTMLHPNGMPLVDAQPIRRFLLEQTQHQVGGFGKCPKDHPDIYHSYLALAALANLGDPDLKPLDTALCISVSQKDVIERYRKAATITAVE